MKKIVPIILVALFSTIGCNEEEASLINLGAADETSGSQVGYPCETADDCVGTAYGVDSYSGEDVELPPVCLDGVCAFKAMDECNWDTCQSPLDCITEYEQEGLSMEPKYYCVL